MKVVRLVKTDDFDIKIVLIRGRMQKLQPIQDATTLDGHTLRENHPGFDFLCGWLDTPGMFVRVLNFAAADFGKQPNTPSRWPNLIETVKIAFGLVSLRGCLLPQK